MIVASLASGILTLEVHSQSSPTPRKRLRYQSSAGASTRRSVHAPAGSNGIAGSSVISRCVTTVAILPEGTSKSPSGRIIGLLLLEHVLDRKTGSHFSGSCSLPLVAHQH